MKVFICRPIPKIAENILRQAGFEVLKNEKDKILSKVELQKAVKGVDAILSLLTDKIDKDIFASAGANLKIVANYAVGFDNIDIQTAKEKKIVVTNTPGVLTEAVAEHAVGLMLAVARRIPEADKFCREGKYKQWMPLSFLGPKLWGKTFGIVGVGRIGSFVGEITHNGFHMKIVYYDIRRNDDFEMMCDARYMSLASVLKQADVVSLHVPLLPQTRHLISTDQFRMMKKTAIIINTSRGPVIDEEALVSALENNEILGAGLDVFENEPAISTQLKKMDNVVLNPHIASATLEAREAMAKIAAENIVAVLQGGKPINPVY